MLPADRVRRVVLFLAGILCVQMLNGALASTTSPVHLDSVVLYQPQEIVAQRAPDPVEFSDYARRLVTETSDFMSDSADREPRFAWLVVAIRPVGQVRVWAETTDPPPTTGTLERLGSRLEAVPPLKVTGGPVVFALHLSLFGGRAPVTSPTDSPMYVPQSWRKAVQDSATTEPLQLESVLELVWPQIAPKGVHNAAE